MSGLQMNLRWFKDASIQFTSRGEQVNPQICSSLGGKVTINANRRTYQSKRDFVVAMSHSRQAQVILKRWE